MRIYYVFWAKGGCFCSGSLGTYNCSDVPFDFDWETAFCFFLRFSEDCCLTIDFADVDDYITVQNEFLSFLVFLTDSWNSFLP